MPKKHMKMFHITSHHFEMQIKTTIRYHFIPSKMTIMKKD